MKETEEKMREVGKMIEKSFPGYGFSLVVFEFGKEKIANYISNARREDMIKALREKADVLERNQDIPKVEGTA